MVRWSGRARAAAVGLALLGAGVLGAGGPAGAASIGIDPPVKLLTCGTSACDSIAVQVTLGLGEDGADGFQFELEVSNASLLGWTPGTSVGSGVPGTTGGVVLQLDGTTLIGSFTTVPVGFDGPQTFDLAILDLEATGTGTAELRWLDAEISCALCNGGAGEIYANSNTAGELLGVITVVPEPGSLGLLALGLFALAAGRAPRRAPPARRSGAASRRVT